MHVLKNYKKGREMIEEFPFIKIKRDEDIFVELPLCAAEFDREYVNPVLYTGPDAQIPLVMEKEELQEKIKGTRLFAFKIVEDNKVEEVDKEKADFFYRLPTNTEINKLAIINGQLGLLEGDEDGNI